MQEGAGRRRKVREGDRRPSPVTEGARWTLLTLAAFLMASIAFADDALRPVDAPDILSLVDEHRGKVVLVNFWATWCPPCIREFPDIVAVEKNYRDRGLVVISVSVNSTQNMDSELLPFLDKHRPPYPVYIMKTTDPKDFVRRIDPQWTGVIPSTLFFDREGKSSVKRYSEMNREEIERILEALLEEPKP